MVTVHLSFFITGAHVVMACRSIGKCNEAAQSVLNITEVSEELISTAWLDLASFASVRHFADGFKAGESTLAAAWSI